MRKDGQNARKGTFKLKAGLAQMLKGGVIMDVTTPEQARVAEEAGACAVMALERIPADIRAAGGVSRMSDPAMIRGIQAAVSIPVIANGDVFSPEDAVRILRQTGADMAMIGRGSFGNPWLFQQCAAALRGEPIPDRPPLAERVDTVVRQIEMAAEQKGERIACLEARKHFAWYLKGIPYAGYYKEQISHVETLEGLHAIAKGIKRDLKDGD